jgi:pilus assembly protein CpaE
VTAPGAAIFAVATAADPDLILQSMRAGANEFFIWPPADETFHGAIRRMATRRETAHGGRTTAQTFVFFGAKGGAGTTTVAVNCGVELARLSKRATLMIDIKPGLGEVALFLGVRSRYSILDAIDNLHRLDPQFLKELVVKHKSGLEILAGSDNFDRPGVADGGAIEDCSASSPGSTSS